jgi:hypothetical protein
MATQFQRKATALIAAVTLMLCTGAGAPAAAPAKKAAAFNIAPIVISSVSVANGELVANGLVGTTPFQLPIVLSPGATPAGATCPVLNLSLGPLHVSLLGLNVDTSPICLEITAIQGGGLLGDLLCGITNLLSGGTPLATILANLPAADLARLTNGLTQVLNQAVFIPLTRSDAVAAASCSILHLELGPLDLNLLGLRVQLNDCSQTPRAVVLDLTATPGGGLLGDLLCNLSTLLSGGNPNALTVLLQQIAGILGGLLG